MSCFHFAIALFGIDGRIRFRDTAIKWKLWFFSIFESLRLPIWTKKKQNLTIFRKQTTKRIENAPKSEMAKRPNSSQQQQQREEGKNVDAINWQATTVCRQRVIQNPIDSANMKMTTKQKKEKKKENEFSRQSTRFRSISNELHCRVAHRPIELHNNSRYFQIILLFACDRTIKREKTKEEKTETKRETNRRQKQRRAHAAVASDKNCWNIFLLEINRKYTMRNWHEHDTTVEKKHTNLSNE